MSSASVAAPRRNRDPHPTKPNAPSMISIFSAHSTSSEASGGSVSTVTAESSSRTRSRDLRHVKSKHGGQRLGSGTSRARPQVRVRGESTLPNVFDYLDKDGHSRNASHVSLGEVESDPTTPHAAAFAHASPIDALNFQNDESDKDSGAQSLHSDSGISIRDSSPEPPKSLSFPLATAGEPCEPQNSSYLPLVSRPRLRHVRSRRVYRPDNKSSVAADYERPSPKPNTTFDTTSPESYYLGAVATKSRDMPTPEREVSQSAGASPAIETSKTSPISSGYALLASRLTSRLSPKQAGIPPLYRKFEGLNHRILLQLQDEIAEMEEELKTLDEADRQCRIAAQSKPTDPVIPASRRLDWQCQRFSALHSRRLDLLGKIYVKVEQYSRPICSTNHQRILLTSPQIRHYVPSTTSRRVSRPRHLLTSKPTANGWQQTPLLRRWKQPFWTTRPTLYNCVQGSTEPSTLR